MNGGHGCLTIEDTKSAGFHADVRSLCDALGTSSEPPPSSGRSEAATQPYTDPFADTLASPASFANASPDWCVDVGTMLLTLSTFDLWEALERGQVLAWMRVWREGMECWTPVGEIPEFAWAIAGTPRPPAEPEALPEPDPPAEARTGPLHAPTVTVEPPPESAVRPIAAPVPRPLHGVRWIAIGSAVAVAAVVSAIFARSNVPPPPAETVGATSPLEGAQPRQPAEDKPAPEAAHHDERGQRRLPRGGGHTYGR
jgi:hypothetical protein